MEEVFVSVMHVWLHGGDTVLHLNAVKVIPNLRLGIIIVKVFPNEREVIQEKGDIRSKQSLEPM